MVDPQSPKSPSDEPRSALAEMLGLPALPLARFQRTVVTAAVVTAGLFVILLAPSPARGQEPISAQDPAAQESDGADDEGTSEPNIVFPVVGPVTYTDTWGACRGVGCSRSHKGVDIFAPRLTPLVAAADGIISSDRRSGLTISGNTVVVRGDDGWRYIYVHLNNDSPGTDDGANPQGWIVPNRLRVGDRVEAGDVIGYLGDSGNAETTPAHVHFEVHKPGVGAINPTPIVDKARAAGRIVPVADLASTPEGRAEFGPVVSAWYRALLKREPSDEELFAWTDRFDIGFATTDDLIADLTMSKQRRDPAGAIVRSFQVSLGRLPTLNELRQWEDQYKSGSTLEEIAAVLINSNPFIAAHGELSDEQFVSLMYRNGIDAEPSARRMQDWLEAFAEGTSRQELTAYLADTYTIKNSTWHELEVIQAYRASLDRLPTSDELDQWVAHLDSGGLIPDVVAGIRADKNSAEDEDEDTDTETESTEESETDTESTEESDSDSSATGDPAASEEPAAETTGESDTASSEDPNADSSTDPATVAGAEAVTDSTEDVDAGSESA